MFNEEIFEKLKKEFAEDKLPLVCDVISVLYDIKFTSTKIKDASCEYDYERDWWMNKRNELLNLKEVIE
jgi:hypothetical protein